MEPTCDECTEGVPAVANVIGSEGKIVEIVDFLKVNNTLCKSNRICVCLSVLKDLKRNRPFSKMSLAPKKFIFNFFLN